MDIEKYYDEVVSIFISNSNDLVPVEFEKNLDNGKSRHLMRYYRHLYQLYKYIYLSEVLTSIKKRRSIMILYKPKWEIKNCLLFYISFLVINVKQRKRL